MEVLQFDNDLEKFQLCS